MYDKVVDVLTLKLSAIKKNIRFIVFFGIGAVIGILGFSFVITWLFDDNFPVATNMFFMGLIIGSIPLIYRNMTVGGRKNHAEMPFLRLSRTCTCCRYDIYK